MNSEKLDEKILSLLVYLVLSISCIVLFAVGFTNIGGSRMFIFILGCMNMITAVSSETTAIYNKEKWMHITTALWTIVAILQFLRLV